MAFEQLGRWPSVTPLAFFFLTYFRAFDDCIGMTNLNRPPPPLCGLRHGRAFDWHVALLPRGHNPRRTIFLDLFLPYMMFSGVLFLVSCGGGSLSSGSAAVSVSASPSNTTMISGTTRQFTAAVSNSANKEVAWSATAGTV